MVKKETLVLLIVFVLMFTGLAWVPLLIENDPHVRMPGTQPAQGVALEGPSRCLSCHSGYDPAVEPGSNWMGSMMAQSARDPIFYACLTVALQDSIWALGNPNAGDLCERCHFPAGWLGGRSEPANASAMTGTDFDGIHCDFCHSMYDPFFETTYNGTREGSDWTGYWDEATALSQTLADETYALDRTLSQGIKMFSGGDFYTKQNVPVYPDYTENGSGQYFVTGSGVKRASFADAEPSHQFNYSRYHKSKYFCATCHDVSNPALANLGLSGLTDQSGGTDLISEQYSAFRYFHVERTFSEFALSEYFQQGGAATNPEFAALSGGISHVSKCQDCHLFDVTGRACDKKRAPIRPGESTEHPTSGMPFHDMTGGNLWISYILASLDSGGPVYDAVNFNLLNQGPAVLTLDLTAGESPLGLGEELKRGADRARDQLRLAAVINNVAYEPHTGELSFRVQNNTGHKLISGFPEGRRMFINVRAYFNGGLIHEVNPYDQAVGTLKGLPKSANSPAPAAHEQYVDECVYEVHPKSDLTGEDETFHFVLATGRYKDNRIPPKGFDIQSAEMRLCEPVWHGQSDPNYFTAAEYAGGYDQVDLTIAHGADRVEIRLYYQGTSREYIEFLRDEINGSDTLSSPTPSGQAQAYVVQSDPFFSALKAWGNTIWNLWQHNHGLDGSGVSVAGIVPFQMALATLDVNVQLPGDFEPDGDVDAVDMTVLGENWLTNNPLTDIAPFTAPDGTVNWLDYTLFSQHWLEGTAP